MENIQFDKILLLNNNRNWNDIDFFLLFEYRDEWIDFKRQKKMNPLYPSLDLQDKLLNYMKKEIDEIPF